MELAVERAVAPLMAQIEEMDARMRLTDILSGLFLIAGLAGMALWATGRRK
jgi:nickel transport protein